MAEVVLLPDRVPSLGRAVEQFLAAKPLSPNARRSYASLRHIDNDSLAAPKIPVPGFSGDKRVGITTLKTGGSPTGSTTLVSGPRVTRSISPGRARKVSIGTSTAWPPAGDRPDTGSPMSPMPSCPCTD